MPLVTWDEINKGSGVVLSNGNLTAVIPNSSNTARASLGRSTGKWYWEVKIDNTSTVSLMGIINSTPSLSNATHSNANAMYYYASNGNKYNGTNSAYGASYRQNDIVSVLIDLDNGTLEYWKNGVSQGVAFSDVKKLGEVFPAVSVAVNTSTTITANFGGTPFAYEIPEGYYSYDENQYGGVNRILILSGSENLSIVEGFSGNPMPVMTANNEPAPFEVSSSSDYSTSNTAYRAFDKVATTYWRPVANLDQYLQIKLDKKYKVDKIYITAGSNVNNWTPRDFVFKGSNDGENWVDLAQFTDLEDASWGKVTNGARREFSINSKNEYKYYRFHIVKSNDTLNNVAIYEFELFCKDVDKLIIVPSNSEKNFLAHGMDKSVAVDLEEPMQNKIFIEQSPTTLGSGKVFKKTIDTSKIPIKKVEIK